MTGCCDKTEDGLGPDQDVDPFLLSINGDTTQDQLIIGTGGTDVATFGGITTVHSTAGTIVTETAPQMFVSPVVSVGGQLTLQYSGKGIIIPGDGSGTMQDNRMNTVAGTGVTTGYTSTNDTTEYTELGITSSTNTGVHGAKRSYISALGNNNTGFDIQAGSGAGKTIKLITNTSVRGTVDDLGFNAALGQTTPATATATDLTLTVTPLSITNGGTSARTLPQAFDNLAPTNGNKGNLIVWNGVNNVNFAGSAGNDTQVLTHDSTTSTGVKWAASTAPANSVVGFQAQTTSAISISDSTSTLVPWSNIILDTANGWNSGTNQYIIPGSGVYYISAQILFVNDFAAYDAEVTIVKNGGTVLQTGEIYHPAISGLGNPMVQGVFSLSTNDTIQINVYQNSGSSQLLDGVKIITTFNIASLGGISQPPASISVGLAVSGGGGASPATVLAVVPASTPVTSTGTLVINYSGTPLPIANGGTNATSKPLCFDNLAPTTTTGDLIYYNGNNLRLPIGVDGSVLTTVSGLPVWAVTTASNGSINYYNGSTYVSLGIGSSGQVLQVIGGVPTWQSISTTIPVSVSASSYVAVATLNLLITCTMSTSRIDVTLPPATYPGQVVTIVLINTATSGQYLLLPLVVTPAGIDVMDPSPITNYALLMTNGQAVTLQSTGYGRWILIKNIFPTVTYTGSNNSIAEGSQPFTRAIYPNPPSYIFYFGGTPTNTATYRWTRQPQGTNNNSGIVQLQLLGWVNNYQGSLPNNPWGVTYGGNGGPGQAYLGFSAPLEFSSTAYSSFFNVVSNIGVNIGLGGGRAGNSAGSTVSTNNTVMYQAFGSTPFFYIGTTFSTGLVGNYPTWTTISFNIGVTFSGFVTFS